MTMADPMLRSKRSITMAHKKTSISLRETEWNALKEIAARTGTTVSEIVATVDVMRRGPHKGRSQAIRDFLEKYTSKKERPA